MFLSMTKKSALRFVRSPDQFSNLWTKRNVHRRSLLREQLPRRRRKEINVISLFFSLRLNKHFSSSAERSNVSLLSVNSAKEFVRNQFFLLEKTNTEFYSSRKDKVLRLTTSFRQSRPERLLLSLFNGFVQTSSRDHSFVNNEINSIHLRRERQRQLLVLGSLKENCGGHG